MAISRSASLTGGGKIFGDLTIDGDLTVNGDGVGAYDEIISGGLVINVTDGQNVKALHITQNDAGEWTSKMDTSGYGLLVRSTANDTTPAIQIQGNGTSNNILTGLSNGNVGIGTASPTSKLSVSAGRGANTGLEILDSADSNNKRIDLRLDADGDGYLSLVNASETTKVQLYSNGVSYFNGGNVGIGTSSPTVGQLQINASADTILALTKTSGATSGNLGVIRFGNTNVDSNLVNIVAYQDGATNAGALKFQTQATGSATADVLTLGSDKTATFAGDVTTSKANATGNSIILQQSLGSLASPSTSADTNILGKIQFVGKSTNDTPIGAEIKSVLTGSVGSTKNMPSSLVFSTQPVGGTDLTTALTLDSSQDAIFANTAIFANNKSINFLNTSGAEKAIITFDSSNITKIGDASSSGTLQLNSGNATFAGNVTSQGASAPSISVLDTTNNASIQMRALDSEVRFGSTSNHPVKIGTNGSYDVIVLGTDKSATFGGNVKITKAESSASEFISALEINRDYASTTTTDLLTGIIFTDDNSVQAGIFTNRYNSANYYNSRLQFYVNNSSSSMTPQTALGDPSMIIDENSRISLSNNDSGASNTVFGKLAGNALQSGGDENVLIGDNAGNDLTTGDKNVIIGSEAGDNLTLATRSVAVGSRALGTEDVGDRSIAIGFSSLFSQNSDSNNETTANIGIGTEAGFYNVTGQHNTFIGNQAGMGASGQSNSHNTGVGSSSLTAITTAAGAVAVGYQSLKALTSGLRNTAVGYNSLMTENTGSYHTALGYEALKVVDADNGHNTGLGHKAGVAISSGSSNTVVGSSVAEALTTGTNNTIVGASANVSASGATNEIVIGQGVTGRGDNMAVIGNDSINNVYLSRDGGAKAHMASIQFPATQNASSNANCLDDYEEGTYTPAISDGSTTFSCSTANGYYTKIGNQVFVQVTMVTSENGSGSSLQITLPFNYNAGGSKFITAPVRYGGLDLDSSAIQVMLGNSASGTSNQLFFSQMRDDNTELTLAGTSMSSGDTIRFNVHYIVA